MRKLFKILKLKKQIEAICKDKDYQLLGNIKKCSIADNHWTFAIKAPNRQFLVKLIVPFGINNTSICINSVSFIFATSTLFGMRGLFGSINIPISREYHFNLPKSEFGLDADKCEKIFLIYPKCSQLYLRETDKNHHLTTFRVGLSIGDIHIHDGSSFRQLLFNQNKTSRFADLGE